MYNVYLRAYVLQLQDSHGPLHQMNAWIEDYVETIYHYARYTLWLWWWVPHQLVSSNNPSDDSSMLKTTSGSPDVSTDLPT